MSGYRICFFNDLPNDRGHMFHCCQRTVEIRVAKSKDRAIEAAKRRFARAEHIPRWEVHARSFEVEDLTQPTASVSL